MSTVSHYYHCPLQYSIVSVVYPIYNKRVFIICIANRQKIQVYRLQVIAQYMGA